MDNTANKTQIKLVQGDTQLQPAQAVTVSQQFISNSSIVAMVGPAGNQEVEAIGNHIKIWVNGKKVVDFVDPKSTYTQGHFAFQQHDPGSKVDIKDIEVMELPESK